MSGIDISVYKNEAHSPEIGRGMMDNPFGQTETTEIEEKEIYFNEVDKQGHVGKYKMESGVPVKVADLGNIKDYFNVAIMKAAMLTPEMLENIDFGAMTHIECAAIKLAVYAAAGDLKATQELFDRVLGKAKMVSESTNLNLTIDDILNGVKVKGDVIDV